MTSERIHVSDPIKYAQRIMMTHLQFIDDKEFQNECPIYIYIVPFMCIFKYIDFSYCNSGNIREEDKFKNHPKIIIIGQPIIENINTTVSFNCILYWLEQQCRYYIVANSAWAWIIME